MKKIIDLDLQSFGQIVSKNEELKDRFEQYIYECEIEDYVGNKIACFENRCVNYEYGVYCDCYLNVSKGDGIRSFEDDHIFDTLEGMKKSASIYGCSDRLQKMLNHTDKLQYSNLFDWYVKKCLEIFFQEEVMESVNWVEDMNYKLYCGVMPDDLESHLECFQPQCGDYFYDEGTNEVFQWRKVS